MKRTLSLIFLVASLLVLILSLFICIYGIYDINRSLGELANDPSASGADYFGIGWGYGINLLATSTLGLILSGIGKRMQQTKILQYVSLAAILIFSLLVVVAIFLFYR